jgi:hypothetical protein
MLRRNFAVACLALALIEVSTAAQGAAYDLPVQQLFAIFRPDSESHVRDSGAALVNTQAEWDQALALLGNPAAPAVDFSNYSAVIVTGQPIAQLCRGTAIKTIARSGNDALTITVEETYPQKCSGKAFCRCAMVAGIPPPIGKTVVAIQVHKPVSRAEVATVSVIDRCCIEPHSGESR